MSLVREFQNIDILLRNRTDTTGVDCFSLSVIKMERQMRRLFTYGIFQLPCFSDTDIPALVDALVEERIYFKDFIRGFAALHTRSVPDLVGTAYPSLWAEVERAIDYRNKIFHGQLTGERLSTEKLLETVESIRAWCERLGAGAYSYFEFQGFDDSFHKAKNRDFVAAYRATPKILSLGDYKAFLETHVKPPKKQ